MNYDRFETYLKAAMGQYDDVVFPISSRDDVERLRYASKRVVLSVPEFVAGLQFSGVIVVDVNRDEVRVDRSDGLARRRFLSELYLASSRAETTLAFFATRERGGLSSLLERPISEGLISRED
jgi:hypothetical protein